MPVLATSNGPEATAQVVAVEPDPRSAAALAALFDGHDQISIDVVATIGAAVEAIGRSVRT